MSENGTIPPMSQWLGKSGEELLDMNRRELLKAAAPLVGAAIVLPQIVGAQTSEIIPLNDKAKYLIRVNLHQAAVSKLQMLAFADQLETVQKQLREQGINASLLIGDFDVFELK